VFGGGAHAPAIGVMKLRAIPDRTTAMAELGRYHSDERDALSRRRCTRCSRANVVGWTWFDTAHHERPCPGFTRHEWAAAGELCHCGRVCRRCYDEAEALGRLIEETS